MSKELLEAVERGDLSRVKYLLDSNASINFTIPNDNHDAITPLGVAVIGLQSVEMVRFLINYKDEFGINRLQIDQPINESGYTALHMLFLYLRLGTVSLNKQMIAILLEAGANLSSKSKRTQTPLINDVLCFINSAAKTTFQSVAEMFLYEAFLRQDIPAIEKLAGAEIKFCAAKLREHIELVPHQLTELQWRMVVGSVSVFKDLKLIAAEEVEPVLRTLLDPGLRVTSPEVLTSYRDTLEPNNPLRINSKSTVDNQTLEKMNYSIQSLKNSIFEQRGNHSVLADQVARLQKTVDDFIYQAKAKEVKSPDSFLGYQSRVK